MHTLHLFFVSSLFRLFFFFSSFLKKEKRRKTTYCSTTPTTLFTPRKTPKDREISPTIVEIRLPPDHVMSLHFTHPQGRVFGGSECGIYSFGVAGIIPGFACRLFCFRLVESKLRWCHIYIPCRSNWLGTSWSEWIDRKWLKKTWNLCTARDGLYTEERSWLSSDAGS